MPAKLIIPKDGFCRPKLRLGIKAGFQKPLRPGLEALTRIVLICFTLWGLFWLQFLTGILYNMPALYTLSGGNWYSPAYEFYQDSPNPYPWSVAWKFVAISCFATSVGLVDAWLFTRHVEGKWRMRSAVGIFATILCGWSVASLKAESGVAEGLEKRIEFERYLWRMSAEEGDSWDKEQMLRARRERIEYLERVLREFQEK